MLQNRHEYAVEIAIFNVQRAITPKICNPEIWFLRSARLFMVLNICVKIHENILNGFEVTERTRVCGKIAILQCSKSNNSNRMQCRVTVPDWAHCLILLNICMKFHENISNGFGVTERTRFCNRLTDYGRHGQKNTVQPS